MKEGGGKKRGGKKEGRKEQRAYSIHHLKNQYLKKGLRIKFFKLIYVYAIEMATQPMKGKGQTEYPKYSYAIHFPHFYNSSLQKLLTSTLKENLSTCPENI